MADFDLSEALEGSPEFSDAGFESRCFNMTEFQEEIFRLDEGLDLVVSHNQKTMQSVATLLLAVNRMKSPLRCGRELSGNELCIAIMDSLVEETIVKTTESFSTGVKGVFRRMSSVNLFTLCDTSDKDIVQESEMKLQAITLKGGHGERKVNFRLVKYIPPCFDTSLPVVLSIPNNNLHISCSMKDGKAVLKLEKCSEDNLKSITDDGDMSRFLFYKRTTGICLNRFESFTCPGWFISTYENENLPVEMCSEVDADARLTCFKLN